MEISVAGSVATYTARLLVNTSQCSHFNLRCKHYWQKRQYTWLTLLLHNCTVDFNWKNLY